MRIGLDVRAMQTQGGSATRGIGRYITDLLEGLLAYAPDDRIVLLALAGRPLPRGWAERCEIAPVEGPIYHEMPKPWYLKIPKIRSNQTLLGRLHSKAVAEQRRGFEAAVAGARVDVLHLPTAVDLGSYPAGDFAMPVVATFHDAIPILERADYYDRWGRFHQRFYDAQLADLKKAARVLTVSEASRGDAIRFGGLPPERVEVLYPSITPAFGVPVDAAPTRAKYGLEGPYALFCSVPDPHKNYRRVVEAFARVRPPGVRLAFVSPLEPPHEARVREAAAEFGLAEADFTITGRVSDAELVALFQAATCLMSPSLVEGFGLPAAQALAAGTPPIVSSRGSQPEVVGDAGLIVDPENVRAIASALDLLLGDPALREMLVRRGCERAHLFTPERQATRLRAVYDEVVREATTS